MKIGDAVKYTAVDANLTATTSNAVIINTVRLPQYGKNKKFHTAYLIEFEDKFQIIARRDELSSK